MPFEAHSSVKTTEVIHYQLFDVLLGFEERLRRLRKSEPATFVWPIFSALVSLAALHVGLEQDLTLIKVWTGAIALYVITYFIVYRLIIRTAWEWLAERHQERIASIDTVSKIREFDEKTTNEILLVYNLLTVAAEKSQEPTSTPGLGLYLAEATHYLLESAETVGSLLQIEEIARHHIQTGAPRSTENELRYPFIHGPRVFWAVQAMKETTERALVLIRAELEGRNAVLDKSLTTVKELVIPQLEVALGELNITG